MTYIHSCSLYCERPECVKAQRDEMRDGIKRHEEMAAMASAEIADLTAELAQLRAVEPVAPPGWREALQFYADRSHFVIADADAWDTVSGEPSNFWCDNGTATVEDGTVAKMALAGTPLSDEDDDGAAPPAQPAEPVQRLSDEQIDAILHEAGVDEFAAIPIEYDRQVARAIESALQPGWRDIESAPKDGTRIILGSSDGAWMAEYQPVYQSGYRPDNPWFSVMLNHAHMGRFPKAKPTHWQPIPPAPKATK